MFYSCFDEYELGLDAKEVIGGKGAGLFEMQQAGIPVPEFVVIPTSLCVEYMKSPAETKMKVKTIAKEVIDTFVDKMGYLPLLSVRSGARVSMPGMMDTILNVGVMDKVTSNVTDKMTIRHLADCNRRFLHMFGSTVHGIPDELFENEMHKARVKASVETDAELNAQQLTEVVAWFKQIYSDAGVDIPGNARSQIEQCIIAVMESWNSPRAIEYRKHNGIPDDWGTAVVVQKMVFGNMNTESGSGVLFTRDPISGENVITGEYLMNAQGEDVVAGIRTPEDLDIDEAQFTDDCENWKSELAALCSQLEKHYADMLDIEFTVEDGRLYLLQVRVAKRSARAWVRTSLGMFDEGLIDRDEVFARIKRDHVKTLLCPVVSPDFDVEPAFTGIPACAGVVTGKAVFSAEEAVASKEPCILVREETSPDDIAGMFAAVGILTATGGSTSHAAVVARGMDKPCVVGAKEMSVSHNAAEFPSGSFGGGTKITIDGLTGRVWVGVDVPVSDPSQDEDLKTLEKFLGVDDDQLQLFCPGNEGSVYAFSQFMSDVPSPTQAEVHVVFDSATLSDPLLHAFGDGLLVDAIESLFKWAKEASTVVLYDFPSDLVGKKTPKGVIQVSSKKGLAGLMSRPVSLNELTDLLGDVDALSDLIAPAKLTDKFDIVGCARYDLLAAFD